MKHWVFCAANIPANKVAIDTALKTVDILRWKWTSDATITGVYDGSDITVNPNDGNNTSICMENDDTSRLIESCMAFTRVNEKLKNCMTE